MLFAEDTLVNLSAPQANDAERTTHDTCGLGFERPLADYDPDTQSWRMFGDTYLWGEPPSLESLPPSGMTRNGVLYPQPAWVPITDATASSSWPTPTAHPDNSNINGKFKNPTLGDAVRMWPTPTTQETEHPDAELTETGRRKSKDGTTSHSLGLADAVRMWPTPTAVTRPMEGNVRLYRAKVEAGEMTEAEAEAILGKSVWEEQGKIPAMWPTPRSSQAMNNSIEVSLTQIERNG